MMVAAKTLETSPIMLFLNPASIEQAKAELDNKTRRQASWIDP